MKKITVRVKTNSKKEEVEKITDLVYKVQLKATPVNGQANKALIQLMADYFNVTKSMVEIKSGKTSKNKVLIIYG